MPDRDIHAVLLVPHDGDPLRERVCGARPPTAWRCTCSPKWRPCGPRKYRCQDCLSQGFPGSALVLAWDRAVVPEVVGWLPPGFRLWWSLWVNDALKRGDTSGLASWASDLGTLVMVDENGAEIQIPG